ncbi:unnamed protein product [Chilo suppressalis]|uniref:Uncharacterized protein n=1 Tax=Chilo suppressalis TaxID=168631 RepID=A0ABN8AYX7_CHISP|nr:unnamed protein product [Chilo suppressalis]
MIMMISGLETSVSFVSSQYEDLKKLMMSNSNELKSLKEENSVLRGNLTALELRVKHIENESARHQQWARLQNVEIMGVPEDAEEDTSNIVLSIAKHIGVDVATDELEFAHRIQPYNSNKSSIIRNIVARFRQRSTKDVFWLQRGRGVPSPVLMWAWVARCLKTVKYL